MTDIPEMSIDELRRELARARHNSDFYARGVFSGKLHQRPALDAAKAMVTKLQAELIRRTIPAQEKVK